MDLNRLKTFKIIAETLSFTETAKTLHLTQSAISQQMKILQEEYGRRLVQKINNHLVLTPEGRTLYQEIAQKLEALEISLKKNQKKSVPEVRFAGAQNFLIENLIPKLPKKNFRYHLDFLNSAQSNEELLQGKQDIVFVSSPLKSSLVESKILFQEDMILVASSKLKEACKNQQELPLVDMSENLRLFQKWREQNQKDFPVRLKAIIPSIQGILSFIRSHPMAAIVPEHLVRKDLSEGNLLSLFPKEKAYTNQVYACILKQQKSETIWNFYHELKAL